MTSFNLSTSNPYIMATNYIEKQAGKFAKMIDPKLPFIEIACLIIVIAAELTLKSNREISSIVIVIILSVLAILYYFSAFRIGEDIDNVFEKFYIRLLGFANAVSVMGLLFFINHYEGARIMTRVGLSSLLIGIILVLGLKFFKKIDNVRRVDIIRSLILLLFVGSIYFTTEY